MSRDYIAELAAQAISDARIRSISTRKFDFALINNDSLTHLTSALHRWFREREFLTKDARPKPLKLTGRKSSVEYLIATTGEQLQARKLATEMINLGFVRKTRSGLYLPVAMHGVMTSKHLLGVAHCLHSLRTFIWNFHSNLTARPADLLFERRTTVNQFPMSEARAFKDLSRQQGANMIENLNEWLEKRQLSHKKTSRTSRASKKVTAGVHVFAYLGK